MSNNLYWKYWKKRERSLKRLEPKCTCGVKHPERTAHQPNCPYYTFWNEAFVTFDSDWKKGIGSGEKRLDDFV